MAAFNKYLSREISRRAWEQILKSVAADNSRLKQLFSRKPIDLYDTRTSLEISGATVKMEVRSYLENLISAGRKGWWPFWPFRLGNSKRTFNYKFNVVVNCSMDYRNAEIWVSNNFTGRQFVFRNGRYRLLIRKVKQVGERNKKLFFELDLTGSVRILFFRIPLKCTLTMDLLPLYDPSVKLIRVQGLGYRFRTGNILLKLLDRFYHGHFRRFLEKHIEVPIEADLFHARMHAQKEMNQIQYQHRLKFHGMLKELELERLIVDRQRIEAVFLADGSLHLTP